MSENSKKWYVLRTAGGKEKKAKEYLEKEIERFGLKDFVNQVLAQKGSIFRVTFSSRRSLFRNFSTSSVTMSLICRVS